MPPFPPLPPWTESPTGYVVMWLPGNKGRWVKIGEADTYAEAVKISCDHQGGNGDGYWITQREAGDGCKGQNVDSIPGC